MWQLETLLRGMVTSEEVTKHNRYSQTLAQTMILLFGWKADQYRYRAAFSVMGYCVCIAKGAAETLKFNMALILLPVLMHLSCDFPRMISRPNSEFLATLGEGFQNRQPSYYMDLLKSIPGITGIIMIILMAISFTLATHSFRRNVIKLPPPLHRLAGFNAFWYAHHLLIIVYILFVAHGWFLM